MKNSGPITSRTPWRGTEAAIVKKSNRLPIVSASSAVATVATVATVAITAASAAPATTTPAAAASAAAAILTLPGLVHGQFASHEILTVEFLNSSLCFLVTGISHEAKAP